MTHVHTYICRERERESDNVTHLHMTELVELARLGWRAVGRVVTSAGGALVVHLLVVVVVMVLVLQIRLEKDIAPESSTCNGRG